MSCVPRSGWQTSGARHTPTISSAALTCGWATRTTATGTCAALELYRELGDHNSEARAHVDIAVRLFKWEGAPRKAIVHAKRAVDLYHFTGYRAGIASALPVVGWCHTQPGPARSTSLISC